MNNSVFGKTMENVKKHRDIKLLTADNERNKLVSETSYYTTKRFSENLIEIEMKKKTTAKMNKSVYLGMSILDITKTLMYKLWYNAIKLKYKEKVKICYMDTDSFIIHIKTYNNIANGVERWFDTFNYDENDKKSLPIGKNKKVIGLFKDELGGKIMIVFVRIRAKT